MELSFVSNYVFVSVTCTEKLHPIFFLVEGVRNETGLLGCVGVFVGPMEV